ncbi:MAG TPA: hypothetical protein VGF57_10440 [Roseiarcus sp.]
MRTPFVRGHLDRLLEARGVEYGGLQPRRTGASKAESVVEYPSLVPASGVRWVQAIAVDLADFEDRLVTVRKEVRHRDRIRLRRQEIKLIHAIHMRNAYPSG